MSKTKTITSAEVAQHNTADDCWIILGNKSNGGAMVCDITKYLDEHPGGAEIMLEFAGKNADGMFEDIGHSEEARKTLKGLVVGQCPDGDDGAAASDSGSSSGSSGGQESKGGLNPMVLLVLLVAIAAGFYFTQMQK